MHATLFPLKKDGRTRRKHTTPAQFISFTYMYVFSSSPESVAFSQCTHSNPEHNARKRHHARDSSFFCVVFRVAACALTKGSWVRGLEQFNKLYHVKFTLVLSHDNYDIGCRTVPVPAPMMYWKCMWTLSMLPTAFYNKKILNIVVVTWGLE